MADFPVIDLPPTDHPTSGTKAPDFTRPLVTHEYWEDVPLSRLTDQDRVLLAFYPMNWGGRSVYLWRQIRDRAWADHLTVVGISIPTPYDQSRFIRDKRLHDYALYSDPANTVAHEYDVVNDLDGMTGITEPRQSVFLLDQHRIVEYAWVATEWPETPPYEDIEHAIRST